MIHWLSENLIHSRIFSENYRKQVWDKISICHALWTSGSKIRQYRRRKSLPSLAAIRHFFQFRKGRSGPRREKNCLQGLRTTKLQTSLISAFLRFSANVFSVTIWSKVSYAYRWKGDQMSYLLVKGFICLSPLSKLKIALLFCSIYKTTISFSAIVFKVVFIQWPMMIMSHYVTWLGEFSVLLFYLPKVTSIGEIAMNCSDLAYMNLNFLKWSNLSVLIRTNGFISYF